MLVTEYIWSCEVAREGGAKKEDLRQVHRWVRQMPTYHFFVQLPSPGRQRGVVVEATGLPGLNPSLATQGQVVTSVCSEVSSSLTWRFFWGSSESIYKKISRIALDTELTLTVLSVVEVAYRGLFNSESFISVKYYLPLRLNLYKFISIYHTTS